MAVFHRAQGNTCVEAALVTAGPGPCPGTARAAGAAAPAQPLPSRQPGRACSGSALTSHAEVDGVQARSVNLNDDLVREVYDGEHHLPGEAQHLVAAVPVYDPAGHGDPRPWRGAEPAGRYPPVRPAQRPPARRSPRQHGRGSRAGPGPRFRMGIRIGIRIGRMIGPGRSFAPQRSARRAPQPMGGRLLGRPANGAARCCGKMAARGCRAGGRTGVARRA